jgi:hypothetical protein
MVLSNCTIPHSAHGYVLETIDDPDSLIATSSRLTAAVLVPILAAVDTLSMGAAVDALSMGAGTVSTEAIPEASRVCSLKNSSALKRDSARLVSLGLDQLSQLKEPDKPTTSKRSEIFKNLFITYLLSYLQAKHRKKTVRWIFNPLLGCFTRPRYSFREFQVLYRYIF